MGFFPVSPLPPFSLLRLSFSLIRWTPNFYFFFSIFSLLILCFDSYCVWQRAIVRALLHPLLQISASIVVCTNVVAQPPSPSPSQPRLHLCAAVQISPSPKPFTIHPTHHSSHSLYLTLKSHQLMPQHPYSRILYFFYPITNTLVTVTTPPFDH